VLPIAKLTERWSKYALSSSGTIKENAMSESEPFGDQFRDGISYADQNQGVTTSEISGQAHVLTCTSNYGSSNLCRHIWTDIWYVSLCLCAVSPLYRSEAGREEPDTDSHDHAKLQPQLCKFRSPHSATHTVDSQPTCFGDQCHKFYIHI